MKTNLTLSPKIMTTSTLPPRSKTCSPPPNYNPIPSNSLPESSKIMIPNSTPNSLIRINPKTITSLLSIILELTTVLSLN